MAMQAACQKQLPGDPQRHNCCIGNPLGDNRAGLGTDRDGVQKCGWAQRLCDNFVGAARTVRMRQMYFGEIPYLWIL